MADIDIVRKERSNLWIWIVLAIVVALALYFMFATRGNYTQSLALPGLEPAATAVAALVAV